MFVQLCVRPELRHHEQTRLMFHREYTIPFVKAFPAMNPFGEFWLITLCLAIATLICLIVWTRHRGKIAFSLALIFGVLTVVVLAIDLSITTENEVVARRLTQLTSLFEAKSPETLGMISAQSPELREMVNAGMKIATVRDLRISDLTTRFTTDGSRAMVEFRISGDMDLVGFGNVGRQPAKFDTVWVKEEGLWKLLRVVRKNPLNDSPMELMRPSAS